MYQIHPKLTLRIRTRIVDFNGAVIANPNSMVVMAVRNILSGAAWENYATDFAKDGSRLADQASYRCCRRIPRRMSIISRVLRMLFSGRHPYNAGEERLGVSSHTPELGTVKLLPGIEKQNGTWRSSFR